jgi:drug/metabolite transporter (DMT)-like permease
MINKNNMPTWVADILLLIVALLWGGGFIGVNVAVNNVPPLYMTSIRFAIAAFLLIVIFFKNIKGFTKKDLIAGIITGTFLFLGTLLQTIAAKNVPVGKLAFLTALNVVIVPFLAFILYKGKLSIKNILSSILALLGIAVLNLKGGTLEGFQKGDILAILCAFCFAGQIVALGHFSKEVEPLRLTAFQLVAASVFSFAGAILFETPPNNLTLDVLGALLYLGIFSTFLAFSLQTIGQKYTSPERASVIMCLESVFAAIFGVILLKEILTLNMIIGCSLIFLGILLAEWKGTNKNKVN